MNTTRANSAAANMAKAVRNVASTAGGPVKQSSVRSPEPVSSEPETVTATVLYVSGKAAKPPYGPEVMDVEIGGKVFIRANDQDDARRNLEQFHLYDQIMDHGVSHEVMLDYWGSVHRERDDNEEKFMKRIGHILVAHGLHEIWQLVYQAYIGEDRNYCLGDETLFLLGKPVCDQDGYEGPPNWRWNSAVERAGRSRAEA